MRILYGVLISFILASSAFAQPSGAKNSDCCFEFDFKFLITHNWAGAKRRDVSVFMDPKAFNDINLRKLFNYFATKYPTPNIMSVRVETSWYRVPAPNIDCEGSGSSEQPDDPERDNYHWALLLRSGENEVYRFNPTLGEKKMETVLIKGKPF